MGAGFSNYSTHGLDKEFLNSFIRQPENQNRFTQIRHTPGDVFGKFGLNEFYNQHQLQKMNVTLFQDNLQESDTIVQENVPLFEEEQFNSVPISGMHKMANEIRMKLFNVSKRQATSRLVLRVRQPMNSFEIKNENENTVDDDMNNERPFITIDYSFNGENGKEFLNVDGDGGLESLLPENAIVSHAGVLENDMNIFFHYIDYFINNLYGMVWWNGFTINLTGDPKNRLQLIDLEMDPLRLFFQVNSIKELDIVRTFKHFELIGKTLKNKSDVLTFRVRGQNASKINIITAQKNGSIVVNFPPYYDDGLDEE